MVWSVYFASVLFLLSIDLDLFRKSFSCRLCRSWLVNLFSLFIAAVFSVSSCRNRSRIISNSSSCLFNCRPWSSKWFTQYIFEQPSHLSLPYILLHIKQWVTQKKIKRNENNHVLPFCVNTRRKIRESVSTNHKFLCLMLAVTWIGWISEVSKTINKHPPT
jgi:hypothetical protein